MEQIVCPLCGSDKITYFCEKNGFDIYDCGFCEAAFVWPAPEEIGSIYEENYYHRTDAAKGFGYIDYDCDKELMKKVFVSYLDKISKLAGGKKIFDIGAASGYFLDICKKMNWDTAGVEISRYAAEKARGKGHKMLCGNLPEMELVETYDAVTMWDVLEHFAEPKKYLQSANKMLKKNGLLLINTIDRSSLWAKLFGKYWHSIIPPEHLFFYSKKSLELLLEQAGFEIIEINKIGKMFSLPYIFKTLSYWQKIKLWAFLERFFNKPFWNKIAIPINLRDNIFLIAKKND